MSTRCPKCLTDNTPDSKFCNSCGLEFDSMDKIPVPPTKTLKTPTEILTRGSLFANRYEIIDELGKGGMGKVYRVEDKTIKQEIALKLIKSDIAADKKTIERFKNELKTTRNIRHKNVCAMYDIGEDKGTNFITMEYVRGGDLKKLIRRTKQLTVGTTISIAKQICEGLSEAHSLGVVHRDLKPNNIMIDDNGNARIMDFGIARTLRGKSLTGSGIMIGTPEYMSPEQVEGKDVDLRSDIYSLGIVLYEMLTGRVPFEGDSPFTIGVKHKSEIPLNPKELNSQIPDDLSHVILRCLEKDKAKRYQSAEELRDELAAFEKGMPTTERESPGRKTSTSKEVTVTFQKRWVLTIAVFMIAAVSVLTFLILRDGKNIIPKEKIWLVVLPFTYEGPSNDDYLANEITKEITSRLNDILELEVISNTSAVQCVGDTISQIREKLKVDYVVNGTIRLKNNPGYEGQVFVWWELIKTSNEMQDSSDNFESPFKDIPGVQGQVSEKIVQALDITLMEPDRKALRKKSTDNPEAYTIYLQGDDYFYRKAVANLEFQEYETAIGLYNKSVDLDPKFIPGWRKLSFVHSLMYFLNIDRTQERLDKSYETIQTALKLDQDDPLTKLNLAYYYYRGRNDQKTALKIYNDIIKIRPNISRNLLARIYSEQGKFEEAIEAQKIQFARDPLDSIVPWEIGSYYTQLRKYEEAQNWYDRSLSISPKDFVSTGLKIFNSINWKGHTEEARVFIQQLPSIPQVDWIHIWLELLDRNYEEALRILENLEFNSLEISNLYFNRDLLYAYTQYKLDNPILIESFANSALQTLEKLIQEQPNNPNYRYSLGLAYAFLGQKEQGLKEGEMAVGLCTITNSAQNGPGYVAQLVFIQILVGEFEDALDNLEELMSIPAGRSVSVPLLRLDPRYDPLRDLPRFKSLMKKYSE
ncbi:protein kinase [Acidobacteriota bacterium]